MSEQLPSIDDFIEELPPVDEVITEENLPSIDEFIEKEEEDIVEETIEELSLIHIWRCRRSTLCRSRWSPYH